MTNEENWKEQEGQALNIWKPSKEGETLVGEVLEIKEHADYGKSYIVKDGSDVEHQTPSHKALQSRMIDVKKGDVVKIEYVKEEAPAVKGQNGLKIYKVFIKE